MDNRDKNQLKSEIRRSVGPNHDAYIHYMLGNEVGAKLQVSKVGNNVSLSLISKTDDVLSTVYFTAGEGQSGSKLTSVALDNAGQRLIFLSDDGSAIQCDLSKLYENKQDKITDLSFIRANALSGKEAKELLERKEATWDQKSLVTVSETGRSTNTIKYITIDGTEWKIGIDSDEFQEKLVAGENIIINGNVISAKDTITIYIGGDGINVDNETNTISVTEDIRNYESLNNKPSINGIELIGAVLGKDLKLDEVEYIAYKEYQKIAVKEKKLYFVCRNPKDVEAEECWRIYLQNKLIGEWDVEGGMVTLPKFPCRLPFRFSGKWQK